MSIYIIIKQDPDPPRDPYIDLKLVPFEGSREIFGFFIDYVDREVPEMDFSFTVNYPEALEEDLLTNDKFWPVFSERVIEMMNPQQLGLRTFRARMQDGNGNPLPGTFHALQVKMTKGLVDIDKSDVTLSKSFPDSFKRVNSLVFKDPAGLPPLFRLREFKKILFVTGELADRLNQADLKGMVLRPLDEFNFLFLQ